MSVRLTCGTLYNVPFTEDDFYEDLGRRIRARRIDQGLTQEQVADEVDLSRTSITNIERGNQAVSAWSLQRLAQILRCDVDDLLPNPSRDTVQSEPIPGDVPRRAAEVVRRLAAADSS